LSQLFSNEGHQSAIVSLSQPGNSLQSAATQRLRGRWMTERCVSDGIDACEPDEGSERSITGAWVGGVSGSTAQPASTPRINAAPKPTHPLLAMLLILLEALAALAVLLLIVWWTMFSGRKRGERDDTSDD
jgi:hypothetical protein